MARRRHSIGILVLCIVVAGLLWGYVSLSRTYEHTISVPLFVTTPPNQALVSGVPDSLSVRIRASGLQILNLLFFSNTSVCEVNLESIRSLGTTHIANAEDIIRSVKTQQAVRIVSVSPNSLTMITGDVFRKRVPVKLITNITCKDGFQLARPPTPDPAFVEIRGTKSVVDSITEWPTKRLYLGNLHSNMTVNVDMSDSMQTNVYTVPFSVGVNVDVQQTADATIYDVPIEVPDDAQHGLVSPARISVVVRGGVEQIQELTRLDIRAYLTHVSSSGIAKPVVEVPNGVKVVSTIPSTVRVVWPYAQPLTSKLLSP